MKVLALRSLNCSQNCLMSDGSSHVFGKNLKSYGKYFCIDSKFLASRFLRAIAYMPGK